MARIKRAMTPERALIPTSTISALSVFLDFESLAFLAKSKIWTKVVPGLTELFTEPHPPMIRSLLFPAVFYPFTLLWAAGLIPFALLGSRRAVAAGIVLYCRIVFVILRVVAGIRVDIRGAEKLPRGRAAFLISKHMSNLDPIVTFYLLPEMTALAKKELFAIPFIGRLLRTLGIVRIDRGAGTAHQQMPAILAEIKSKQRPLVVYPEGTRTHPGERRKLKSGAYYMHTASNLEALPMCTNSGLHWPKGKAPMRSGTVIYEIGAPLEPLPDKAAYMRQIEERVMERSDELMRADPVWPKVAASPSGRHPDEGRGP